MTNPLLLLPLLLLVLRVLSFPMPSFTSNSNTPTTKTLESGNQLIMDIIPFATRRRPVVVSSKRSLTDL